MATNLKVAPRKLISINPATGETLCELDCASEQDVREAVARARSAQPKWRELGIRRRVAVLEELQHVLCANKSNLAQLISREVGKPYAEALTTEVLVVLDSVRFYSDNAYRLLRTQPVSHGNLAMKQKSGHIVREPVGVVAIISPWNYPFATPATETLAALIAGNAVIVKPSEFTPLIMLEFADLLDRAGVPDHIFQVLVGDGSTGAALINAEIDKLIFTGSVSTGKRVGEMAGARLLPVVLELGGKDPMLVFEDAPIDVASSAAVWGAFVNAGQACLSVERCYVQRSIHDAFLGAVVNKTQRLRIGNGMNPEIDIGPMIHQRQLEIVEQHVEDAKNRGARIVTGGSRLPGLGPNFYAPTVLTDVTHEMRIMREETFGPVLPIMAFDTEDEAIQLANDSEFGLGASIFTRDRARGEAIARRIASGTVLINDVVCGFGISEAPHGGVKSSGIGRTHGSLGLEEMVNIKYIASDRLPGMKKVWWFPYAAGFPRQIEGLLDMQFAGSLKQRVEGALRSVGCLFGKRL